MRKLLVICLGIGLSSTYALGKVGVEVEPIVGYERQQKLYPTPHRRDVLVYGALVTLGVPLLSVESEYLHSMDTETSTSPAFTNKETIDKVKVGGRSTVRLVGFLYAWARLGVQAKRIRTERTVGGVTTTSENPVDWDPYAGAGLRAKISPMFAFDAGVTVIFNDWPDMNRNEYALTAGFTIKLGSTSKS